MHRIKLLGLTLMALFAFAAFTAVAASAENPEILVLSGTASQLKGEFCSDAGATPSLVNLTGEKEITATKACANIENCENLAGAEKDTNLCNNVLLTFTGVKLVGGANCRSENNKGEKDPVETILLLADLHLSAGENAAKELKSLLLAQVLGTAGEEEVKFNCSLLKIKVTGVVECLVDPALTNTTHVELLCKVNTATHDREIDTCTVLCTEFGGTLGLTAEYGKEKLDAWELAHLLGEFNKDVFIDD